MASIGQRIIRIAAFVNIRCIFDALTRFVLFVKFVVVGYNRNFSHMIFMIIRNRTTKYVVLRVIY